MNLSQKVNKSFSVVVAAADAAKDLIAAPGAGKRIVITHLNVAIKTSAAQTVDIADTSNTVKVAQLGTNHPVGNYRTPFRHVGLPLTTNEALRYIPSAAGYALLITGEYFIE